LAERAGDFGGASDAGRADARTAAVTFRRNDGSWNRIVLDVEEFDEMVNALREAGAKFRNEPISGPGGRQVLIEDPSGNPIELFEARD
jgi:predicted enzyme related to lactoylglutathione lyase